MMGWLLFLLIVIVSAEERCHPLLHTPGVTIPQGDISLLAGSPLDILCVLSPEFMSMGFNSTQLLFTLANESMTKYVRIVNESTVRLHIKEHPPMDAFYTCNLKKNEDDTVGVCINSVRVGYPPKELKMDESLRCWSDNWKSFTCRWYPPFNPVKTNYQLSFSLPGRNVDKVLFECPEKMKGDNYCTWDLFTKPAYRMPYDTIYLHINITNKLGHVMQKIEFDHYAHVKPAKPEKFKLVNKTSSSVFLQWLRPLPIFPPGIVHRIEYTSTRTPNHAWTTADNKSIVIDHKSPYCFFNVTELQYANTPYDFRLFLKSGANHKDDLWSEPATLTVKTESTIPGAPPKVVVGSFEVKEVDSYKRDIYIHWQHVPDHLHNGDKFHYLIIVCESGIEKSYDITTEKAFYSFHGLSWSSYTFKIYSVNEVGITHNYSEIFVPSHGQRVSNPLTFTKIAYDNYTYELSWKRPDEPHITSYTIFWCDSIRDRPYDCEGTLNWTTVPSDVFLKNITVLQNSVYQFAISANTEFGSSSGMVWASCTILHDRTVSKMEDVWKYNEGSRYVAVGWKLECSHRIGVVTGYKINYCPVVGLGNDSCKEEPKNTTIPGDGMTILGNLTGLTPNTVYKIAVAVITKDKQGQFSGYINVSTLPAAPDTPPQDVTVSEVDNNSALVCWTPPARLNGYLNEYKICVNSLCRPYNRPDSQIGFNNSLDVQYRLKNLTSYTNYSVTVAACTNECSNMSSPVQFLTEIGEPGPMANPQVVYNSNTEVKISWKAPEYRAGHLDIYQICVTDTNRNTTIDIKNSTDLSMLYELDCNIKTKFAVRAVNYDGNLTFYGPWTEAIEGSCTSQTEKNMIILLWLVLAIVMVIGGIAAIVGANRLLKEIGIMRKVDIKNPPGLDGNDMLVEKHFGDNKRNPQSSDASPHPQPDQQHLLDAQSIPSNSEEGDNSSLSRDIDSSSNVSSTSEGSMALYYKDDYTTLDYVTQPKAIQLQGTMSKTLLELCLNTINNPLGLQNMANDSGSGSSSSHDQASSGPSQMSKPLLEFCFNTINNPLGPQNMADDSGSISSSSSHDQASPGPSQMSNTLLELSLNTINNPLGPQNMADDSGSISSSSSHDQASPGPSQVVKSGYAWYGNVQPPRSSYVPVHTPARQDYVPVPIKSADKENATKFIVNMPKEKNHGTVATGDMVITGGTLAPHPDYAKLSSFN